MDTLTHAYRLTENGRVEIVPDQPATYLANTARPENAAPDLPPVIGWSVIGAFMATMALFIAFFSGSLYATFMTIISLIYLIAYVTVPVVFFRIQPRAVGQIGWTAFRKRGLDTWTGHRTANEAMTEILTIPVGLIFAVLGVGTVWTLMG